MDCWRSCVERRMETMTQNTLADLRSMEHATEDTKDRYLLGLCTLFVATIEDAKDRISQLELVFCSQLFPAFQERLHESRQTAQEAEGRHHQALQEWEASKESLHCEIRELRAERDSYLQGKEISCDILKLREELLVLEQKKQLLIEEGSHWKLRLQEQETHRKILSDEIESLQHELVGLRNEKGLQKQNGLHTGLEPPLKDSLQHSLEQLSEEATELRQSNTKLQQENQEIRHFCSKISSELASLKADMPVPLLEASPNKAKLEDSEAKSLQLKLERKSQERSLECFRRQLLSTEVEKEKKATHAALVKLHSLKKRYQSLRKQYTVLFRHIQHLGHLKQAEHGSFCELQGVDLGDARVTKSEKSDRVESKKTCNCRKVEVPSDGIASTGVDNSFKCIPSSEMSRKYSRSLMLCVDKQQSHCKADATNKYEAAEFVATNDSPQNPDYSQSPVYLGQEAVAGDHKVEKEDTARETCQQLKSLEERTMKKNPSLETVLPVICHEQELYFKTSHSDKASQIGPCHRSLLPLAECDPDPNCNSLAEQTDSCNSNEEKSRPLAGLPPSGLGRMKNKGTGVNKSAEHGWFPVLKRGLANKPQPRGLKSLKNTWKNTRSRVQTKGFDPHDDFLNTPHETIIRNNADTVVPNKDVAAATEKGNVEQVIGNEGKDVSFSQITTQAPENEAHVYLYASKNIVVQEEQTRLEPSGSNGITARPNKRGPCQENPENLLDSNKSKNSIKLLSSSKQGPMYKYVETVRKKDEREMLQGVECNQCRKFYDVVLECNGQGAKVARCEHHNVVSRHRYRYVPPSTPEGFWNIGFDSEL